MTKKQRKPEKVLALVKALEDETDRYGVKYKEMLSKIPLLPCFICTRQMAGFGVECFGCDKTIYLCNKCEESASMVIGWGACVFCRRKNIDDAKELKTYIDNNLIVGSMPEHLQIFLNKISEE